MNKLVLSFTTALFLTCASAHAGDALSGINLGSTEIGGRVELGHVEVDGKGSTARISGVYTGEDTRLGSADINRYIHTDRLEVSNGGVADIGAIYTGGGTNIDRLEVGSSVTIGHGVVDDGYLSAGVLELYGIKADRLVYNESIEADYLGATNGGSLVIGGIHQR